MAAKRKKANCLTEAVRGLMRLQVAGRIAAAGIDHFKSESSSWPGHQLHGNAPAAPWLEFILTLAFTPDVASVAAIPERPAPMARCQIPSGCNRENVARLAAFAKNPCQLTMNAAAAFAIAPRRYNRRAADDANPLIPTPPSRIKKRLCIVWLPIGEHQVSFGGKRVNDFCAGNAVGAVACFKAAI